MNDSALSRYLTGQAVPVAVDDFAINMLACGLLAWVLHKLYVRYGTAWSDRRALGANFVMLALTTLLIITVVKYSLALSLGLVGALSIVRFRTPVKEPEELAYIFLAIGLGLGFGADQRIVTALAALIIFGAIILRHRLHQRASGRTMQLEVFLPRPADGRTVLVELLEILRARCRALNLRRFDDSGEGLEASFDIVADDVAALEGCRAALRERHPQARIVFLDPRQTF